MRTFNIKIQQEKRNLWVSLTLAVLWGSFIRFEENTLSLCSKLFQRLEKAGIFSNSFYN